MEKLKLKLKLTRDEMIQNMMWKEVAHKSLASSFSFVAVGILTWFYYYQAEEAKHLIRFFCLLIIFPNLVRLWLAGKFKKADIVSRKDIRTMTYAIWVSAFGWGMTFATAMFVLPPNSYHFGILLGISSGIIAGCILTLGYRPTLYYPFIALNLLPLYVVSFYHYFTGINPYALYLVGYYGVAFFYLVRQYRDYNQQLMERFGTQLDLEKSLQEVKLAQETLVNQTTALLHASKISALGEMAGGLSHEVNNSLQVILGSSQQIERELKKNEILSPSVEKKLGQSGVAIGKIRNVIEGLRYFSQEMGPSSKEDVPLRRIYDRVLVFTQELLHAHGVELKVAHIPDLHILCHEFQITQILFNLIKNADDAIRSQDRGEKWIEISFEETKEFIRIIIRNSGPQIRPENQSRLFQPFFSTKDVNMGSGLSLSISRGIARDHKGDLFFIPQDQFTTFVLKLPKNL